MPPQVDGAHTGDGTGDACGSPATAPALSLARYTAAAGWTAG
jgi:hypothetical protein